MSPTTKRAGIKVVILAGGLGTRLAEETEVRPKPMVEIGDRPILWHIMKHYAHHGFDEFVVALGYKGQIVKQYFHDYARLAGSITVQLADGTTSTQEPSGDDWTVHLVDTGRESMTGGRLGRLRRWIGDETFMLTYGDGVSNIDLGALLDFHRGHGKLATISAVRPPARFGALEFDDGGSVRFLEKPQTGEAWINGGYMVLEPAILDEVAGDQTVLETDVLEALSSRGELMGYRHADFWQCVDTLRELRYLRSEWDAGKASWRVWGD